MLRTLVFPLCLAIAPVSLAQKQHAETHGAHRADLQHASDENTQILYEGGQSTFAALIEVTALLEADPGTDWATVDLDGLHSHLLDMNHLMLSTNARTEILDDNFVTFTVTGSADAIPAIHRMVPAHTRFLAQSRGWDIDTELTDSGAKTRISAESDEMSIRLKALGFYGFMALDSHHQAHHLRIVRGLSH